jgi:hypothetical protein
MQAKQGASPRVAFLLRWLSAGSGTRLRSMASTCAPAWAIRSMGALALGTALAVVSNRASACEYVTTTPYPGVLSGDQQMDGEVPTTVAFLTDRHTRLVTGTTDQWIVAQVPGGVDIVAVEVPGTKVRDDERIVKPIQPLLENLTFEAFRWGMYWDSYQTTASRDETAPSRPEVVGGDVTFYEGSSCGSCGESTWAHIELKAAASDDQTPQKRLVYAIYLGSSQDEVQTVTAHALYMGSRVGDNSALRPTLRNVVSSDWLERNVFVAVAAIDQSGNVSERSTPVQIHTADTEGCTIKRHGRPLRFSPCILLAIVALEWRRRRRNAAAGPDRSPPTSGGTVGSHAATDPGPRRGCF